jgi:hypothetical protein
VRFASRHHDLLDLVRAQDVGEPVAARVEMRLREGLLANGADAIVVRAEALGILLGAEHRDTERVPDLRKKDRLADQLRPRRE